ncbi:MAG: hypothetical protein AAGA90_20050 [Actinomycetota bacterium]
MTDTYHPEAFADAWLSAACASGAEKDRPALNRTVLIEQYDGHGARLVSTDGYVLFSAWVPSTEATFAMWAPPLLMEAPDRVAVAMDTDGRAASLFKFIRSTAAKEDGPDLGELTVSLGDPADHPDKPGQLAGMAVTYVSFELPNRERLQLPIFEGKYPDWRGLADGFIGETTDRISLGAENLKRIAKLMALRPSHQLRWTFGGTNTGAWVEVYSDEQQAHGVRVEGLAMPVHWDVELNQPMASTVAAAEETEADDEDGDGVVVSIDRGVPGYPDEEPF